MQQQAAEWTRPVVALDGEEKEVPRVAGISSFGAGGSNAHLVLEEYVPQDNKDGDQVTETEMNEIVEQALIVLSAKNTDTLKGQAANLVEAMKAHAYGDADLTNIAFTLQEGRELMPERLATIVSSVAELTEKLEAFVRGEEVEDLFSANVKAHKATFALLDADKEMALTVERWMSAGKYNKVMELWTKGLLVDWTLLYRDAPVAPRLISLPTYPFNKKRYWIGDTASTDHFADMSKSADQPSSQGKVDAPVSPKVQAKTARKPKEEEPFELMTFSESWEHTPLNINEAGLKFERLVCFLSDEKHFNKQAQR